MRYSGIQCKDGFSMSVQASSGHYCSPRNDVGPYIEVEVGYPSEYTPELRPYMEKPNTYYVDNNGNDVDYTPEEYEERVIAHSTNTVYGWVPSAIVADVIKKHGGVVQGTMPTLQTTITYNFEPKKE